MFFNIITLISLYDRYLKTISFIVSSFNLLLSLLPSTFLQHTHRRSAMSYQNDELNRIILIIISWNLYSYSKFELLIIFILNNMYHVVNFGSPKLNIYTNRKIRMNRLRKLKYSLKGCVFPLHAAPFFFSF